MSDIVLTELKLSKSETFTILGLVTKMSLFGVLPGYIEQQVMHIIWEKHKNTIPTMLEKCSHGMIKLLVIKFYWLS